MDTTAKTGKGLAMQTTEITIAMNANFTPDERDKVLTKAAAVAQRFDSQFEIVNHCISRRVIVINHWYNDAPAVFEEAILPALNAVCEQKRLKENMSTEWMQNLMKYNR